MAAVGTLPGREQTALDRDEGRERVPISNGDSRFMLSGETFQSSLGNISDNSILTVSSLTEDLDTAIIFCGADVPKSQLHSQNIL